MNYERRNEVCKKFFEECMDMGGTKGVEYTRDDDALSNFTGVAEDLGILNPFQVIYVYAKKHWDAIRNFAKHGKVFSNEGIRGRLVDMAVYCALMACWLEEEAPSKESPIPLSELMKKDWQHLNLTDKIRVHEEETRAYVEDPRLGDNPDAYITHPISGDAPTPS